MWKCVAEQHITESWYEMDYPDYSWPYSIEIESYKESYNQGYFLFVFTSVWVRKN